MARPKNSIKTQVKTISVNAESEKYMQENGLVYKNIISLGINAHKAGWNSHQESNQTLVLQEKVSKFALMLDTYARRFEKLCVIVEKGLSIKINDDLSNIEELQEKLDKVYKLGER
jgi:uncharacterized membrane protein